MYILVFEVLAPKLVTCCSDAAALRPLSARALVRTVFRGRIVSFSSFSFFPSLVFKICNGRTRWMGRLRATKTCT